MAGGLGPDESGEVGENWVLGSGAAGASLVGSEASGSLVAISCMGDELVESNEGTGGLENWSTDADEANELLSIGCGFWLGLLLFSGDISFSISSMRCLVKAMHLVGKPKQ